MKLNETAHDDWLSDVVYVGTSNVPKPITTYELVNNELGKYDAEPQIQEIHCYGGKVERAQCLF